MANQKNTSAWLANLHFQSPAVASNADKRYLVYSLRYDDAQEKGLLNYNGMVGILLFAGSLLILIARIKSTVSHQPELN